MNEELTTAGDTADQLAAEIESRFSPGWICDRLEELMTARLPDKVDKNTGEVIEGRPDATSRGTGLRMYFEWRNGEHARRMAKVAASDTPKVIGEGSQERMLRSPAAMRMAAAMLADSAEGRRAMEEVLCSKNRSVEIVEVEPECADGEG